MTRNQEQIFDGKPVLQFDNEVDRRNFLRTALIVGVGAGFAGHALGDPMSASRSSAFAGNLAAKSPQGDLDILNYALTLEYLEADFYTRGVKGGVLKGRELELVSPIRDHEQEHVDVLTSTVKSLGGKPADKPEFMYPDGTFTDRSKFLMTASVFEELGVKAYHGQVPLIESGDILAAAASIAGVESRHAAILADLTGGDPFPRPIEATLPMKAVLAAAMPFIKS